MVGEQFLEIYKANIIIPILKIYSFDHLVGQHFLSTYYVPGIMLGPKSMKLLCHTV